MFSGYAFIYLVEYLNNSQPFALGMTQFKVLQIVTSKGFVSQMLHLTFASAFLVGPALIALKVHAQFRLISSDIQQLCVLDRIAVEMGSASQHQEHPLAAAG